MVYAASDFGTGQVLWSMLWFFLFFIWIWLLIVVFGDIFRSHDLSGWGKALWTMFVIVLPYLGVFVYLIARGHKMSEHAAAGREQQDAAMRSYVRSVARSGGSTADEIARLASCATRESSPRRSSSRPRHERWPDRPRSRSERGELRMRSPGIRFHRLPRSNATAASAMAAP